MRKFVTTSLALCAVCVAIPATLANAEPVTIAGGRVTAQMTSGTFTFTGTGLSLTGDTPGFAGEIFQCEPCSARDRLPFNLSSSTGGPFSSGPAAEFKGTEYRSTNFFGHFGFASPETFTSATGLGSVTAPFTFSGEILNFRPGGEGFPIFFAELSGTGFATAHFRPVGQGLFFADSITYDFTSPAPEPASLLLLGTGAATVLARARRKLWVSVTRRH